MKNRVVLNCWMVAVVVALMACAPEHEDTGAAPQLKNLQATPQTISVNTDATVRLTFEFSDADKDAKVTQVEAVFGTSLTPFQDVDSVEEVHGKKSGTVTTDMILNSSDPGTWTIFVRMLDDLENRSNKLDVKITAQ